jgi:hypothetical protein
MVVMTDFTGVGRSRYFVRRRYSVRRRYYVPAR